MCYDACMKCKRGEDVADKIEVAAIMALHCASIVDWKAHGVTEKTKGFLALVEKNHAFNYQLWHAEDKARREDKGHTYVYHAKREIDAYNQSRNDCMEAIDDDLFVQLKPAAPEICPVHSETPGMMIDRLSILALKHYHMAIQTVRQDVDAEHRTQCLHKLAVIQAQTEQLGYCLTALLQETIEKTRTFRIYRQFKMYNSKALNPALYASD